MAKTTQEVQFDLLDRDDLTPICPHCDAQVHEVYRKATGVAIGQGRATVYFCSKCHRVLGFAQGRMI